MNKMANFVPALVFLICCSPLAQADGVVKGQAVAAEVADALGAQTVTCASATDRITLEVNSHGDLRMIAHYAGNISGSLDTDNEGAGGECGGLSASFNKLYSDFVLEDDYNDCERGDWGYRIMIPESALTALESGFGRFSAKAYARDQDTNDGALRSLDCSAR